MQETKIVFSKEELHLLNNSSVWKYKRSLTAKLYELLGHCASMLKNEHEGFFKQVFHNQHNINARISKGENYLGNPYVILDYPNVFARDKVFAIRTMFWYGELLSCSLVIGGEYMGSYSEKIISHLISGEYGNMYFSIADDPWQHHFDESNVKKISDMNIAEIKKYVAEKSFIKISMKISPDKPDEWDGFIFKSYRIFRKILGD